jgi:hypothetical protein
MLDRPPYGMMQTMSTVSTVLTAGVVSAVVSIFFEWIAKPRMDARKERILNDIGNRRKFENNLLRLEVASGMWAQFKYPASATRQTKEAIDAERQRAYQQIDNTTKGMADDLGFYALTYFGVRMRPLKTSVPEMISRYVYCVRGVYLSNRTYTTKAEIIRKLTGPMRTFLFGGKLHWLRRVNALFEMQKLLDEYAPLDDSEATLATEKEIPPGPSDE